MLAYIYELLPKRLNWIMKFFIRRDIKLFQIVGKTYSQQLFTWFLILFVKCFKVTKTWSWMLPFCAQESVSLSVTNKVCMCGKMIKSVRSQSFSALQWQRVNQHGCTLRNSNSTPKKYFCYRNTNRLSKWSMQIKRNNCTFFKFSG